jgi:predicted acylesterase/phospholipase RssA
MTDTRALECDLIMKGGVTSGLVYPGAIATLSETFRLRNIGGTSAGAIGAVAAAATPPVLCAVAAERCRDLRGQVVKLETLK